MTMLEKLYQKRAARERSPRQRLVALAFLGVLFLLVVAFSIVVLSAALDKRLKLPRFSCGAVNKVTGVLLAVTGLALGLWSNYAQFTIGRGTPAPVMPTQRSVVQPPYTYCRNPMTLGTALAHLGIAVWVGSFSAVGLVLVFLRLLVSSIRSIEEKELAVRFGEEYLAYKQHTLFLIPRIPPRYRVT